MRQKTHSFAPRTQCVTHPKNKRKRQQPWAAKLRSYMDFLMKNLFTLLVQLQHPRTF